MPSFAVNVLSLPHGFVAGCKEVNFLAESSEQYGSVVRSVMGGGTASVSVAVSDALTSLRTQLIASRPVPSAEEITSALRSSTMLSEAAISPIASAWLSSATSANTLSAVLAEGELKQHTMELTYAEFQDFVGTIREVGSAMDVL